MKHFYKPLKLLTTVTIEKPCLKLGREAPWAGTSGMSVPPRGGMTAVQSAHPGCRSSVAVKVSQQQISVLRFVQ